MKKKLSITVLILILVGLILPEVMQKQSIPADLIDATVSIIANYSEEIESSSGSGFIISKTSTTTYIGTAAHVIDGDPESITVAAGNVLYSAYVVCEDDYNDVAVIAIDEVMNFNPLPLSEAGLGSQLYAAGYPYNGNDLEHLYYRAGKTITAERLIAFTGKNLLKGPIMLMIAPTGAGGFSGGPLVNGKGEVVGIISVNCSSSIDELKSVKTMGAVSSTELAKLCRENGIPYTHHISTRLIRDIAILLLLLAIVWISTPNDENSPGIAKNNGNS